MLDRPLLDRLLRSAAVARWTPSAERFAAALEAAAGKQFQARTPSRRELERFLDGLHLADVALACACADGREDAWDFFVAEHRPILYRAADAIDSSGGARETADELYAELFGVRGEGRERASPFRYFHGRSSLATWLRAVLAQRHVDRIRERHRLAPLEEAPVDGSSAGDRATAESKRAAAQVGGALRAAIAGLPARDRLRLRAYYEQNLTLAQVGRLTGEHEATVSRQIAKTRKGLRAAVENQLRAERLSDTEIAEAVAALSSDAGPLDLAQLFGPPAGKISAADRSR